MKILPVTYYHTPVPPGYPQPWWLQAMRQFWHTIGQIMLTRERATLVESAVEVQMTANLTSSPET